MPGRGNIPDGLAYQWVKCEESRQADQLFERLVRAVEDELLAAARAFAYRIVRDSNDVDDAINDVWVKILGKWRDTTEADPAAPGARAVKTGDEGGPGRKTSDFDPSRAPFTTYFFMRLRSACYDICRRRQTAPLPVSDVVVYEDRIQDPLSSEGKGLEEEILRNIESIECRITAAIEVLDFSERHRDMLRLMLEPEESPPPADPKAAAAARKQKERLRDKVADLAGLTPGEQQAASLVRRHHTVAAAAAAAPDVEVRRLYASAKRKVAALFDIETEDDQT